MKVAEMKSNDQRYIEIPLIGRKSYVVGESLLRPLVDLVSKPVRLGYGSGPASENLTCRKLVSGAYGLSVDHGPVSPGEYDSLDGG